jgi:catechol 2,3-dioxygenase-like lactoylglutathione lyase family enzyme
MPFQVAGSSLRGVTVISSSCPTRGIDHIGKTVPDLDAASAFFEQVFDAVPPYDNVTRAQGPMKGVSAEKVLYLAPTTFLLMRPINTLTREVSNK